MARANCYFQAFTEDAIGQLKGHLAIGHTRYSTAGSSTLVNAQPFSLESAHGPIATAHNGQVRKHCFGIRSRSFH
jgi:amidophosphoribosyltransferase